MEVVLVVVEDRNDESVNVFPHSSNKTNANNFTARAVNLFACMMTLFVMNLTAKLTCR